MVSGTDLDWECWEVVSTAVDLDSEGLDTEDSEWEDSEWEDWDLEDSVLGVELSTPFLLWIIEFQGVCFPRLGFVSFDCFEVFFSF